LLHTHQGTKISFPPPPLCFFLPLSNDVLPKTIYFPSPSSVFFFRSFLLFSIPLPTVGQSLFRRGGSFFFLFSFCIGKGRCKPPIAPSLPRSFHLCSFGLFLFPGPSFSRFQVSSTQPHRLLPFPFEGSRELWAVTFLIDCWSCSDLSPPFNGLNPHPFPLPPQKAFCTHFFLGPFPPCRFVSGSPGCLYVLAGSEVVPSPIFSPSLSCASPLKTPLPPPPRPLLVATKVPICLVPQCGPLKYLLVFPSFPHLCLPKVRDRGEGVNASFPSMFCVYAL